MKTSKTSALVALLMFSGVGLLSAPTASAEAEARVMTVSFSYNAKAPAAETYSRFQNIAARACREPGPRPIAIRRLEWKCADQLMDAVVAKVGRADIAEVHTGKILLASR